MNEVFKLVSDITTECGILTVENVTDYSTIDIEKPDQPIATESDFVAVYFFYENDVLKEVNFDNTNPTQFEVINNHSYKVIGYLIPVWWYVEYVPGSIWQAGCIVYNQGKLYFCDSAPTDSIEPYINANTSDPDWFDISEMSISDLKDRIDLMMLEGAPYIYDAQILEVVDCPDYKIVKQSCNIHRIYDNSGVISTKIVRVLDYEQNLLISTSIPEGVGYVDIDLSDTGDGVYIVEIEDEYDIAHYDVIYEFCSLENCVWFTIDKILCSNDPCQEICNPCSPEVIYRQEKDRLTLNKLIATFGSLMAHIHIERIKYMGIFTLDLERQAFVTKIAMELIKIKKLTIQCGMCYGENITNPDSTNTTFGDIISNSTTSSQTCNEC
jgi:hypothetical protein